MNKKKKKNTPGSIGQKELVSIVEEARQYRVGLCLFVRSFEQFGWHVSAKQPRD